MNLLAAFSRRWVIYVRVSTDDQAREGVSMEGQEQSCRALLASRGIRDAEVVQDAGFSAKDLRRPGASRLLDDLQQGRIAGICAWRLDRLTRSLRDMLHLIDLCDRHQVQLLSVTDSIDTTTVTGRLQLNILGSFGQYERETISERVRMSIALRKARGSFTGGQIPSGLRTVGSPGHRNLVIDEATAPVIRLLWIRYLGGDSLGQLSDWLNAQGIRMQGGRTWCRQAVRRALLQRRYIGMLVEQATFDAVRVELVRRRPEGRKFGGGSSKRIGRGANRIWILAGVARCACCGSPLNGVTGTGAGGRSYPYYRCANRSRSGGCQAKELPAQTWEEAVIEGLSRIVQENGPLLHAWGQERSQAVAAQADLLREREGLVRQCDGVAEKISRLVTALAEGAIVAAAVRTHLETLSEERDGLEARLTVLDARLATARITEADLSKRCEDLRRGIAVLGLQPASIQQQVLSALVAEVRLGRDHPMAISLWPSNHRGSGSAETTLSAVATTTRPDSPEESRAGQNTTESEPKFVQPSRLAPRVGFEPTTK